MNELVALSDAELDKAIDDLKERELALKTESGQKYIVSRMRELIMTLEQWGYKTTADELALAKLWANGLQEEFVRLGADGLKQAVTEWAQNDSSEYRNFPKIPWIKEACSNIGGDPRVEKGRRVQALEEARIEEEHRREIEEFKKNNPEKWAELTARVQERGV